MTELLRTTALAVCLAGVAATPALGQGVPVNDSMGIAQLVAQLDQMAQDYQAQLDQIAELQRQYQTLVQQYEAITGARDIADILNAGEHMSARVASADGMFAIVDAAIAGTEIAGNASVIDETLNDLRDTFDLADLPDFLASELAQDRAIATQAGSGMAAIATAEDTYDRANASMERVNQLIALIDANDDLKASVDYNSRLLAEVIVVLNEQLRLQAVMANSLGVQALADARDGVASRHFMQTGEN